MSLLRRIQDATVDPKFQLADILRMCKILAARLEHPLFKEWIKQELNGYDDNKEQLPDYRVLRNLGCRGDFFGPFGSGLKNAPIPPIYLPEEFREAVSTKYVFQSVSALESNVGQANQSNQSILRMLWAADAVVLLGSDIYESMVCGQAWTDIPTAALVAILDTIKSRILDFVIEIEAEAPNAGDAEPGKKPIPDKEINYIFNRCILHQHNQTASSGSFIQTHNQQDTCMPDNYVNNLQGANVGNMANTVKDDARQQANQHIHLSESKKTLAEAAAEIQQLLKQLEQTNPTATEPEMVAYVTDETTPSFKRRVTGALQASGETAIDEFILENKYLKVAKAAIKGWLQPGS
jgi:AbiTii